MVSVNFNIGLNKGGYMYLVNIFLVFRFPFLCEQEQYNRSERV